MKVVLDTNVVVSGLFFGGQPRAVLDGWADGRLEVVITPSILDEYLRVCERLRSSHPGIDYRVILLELAARGVLVPDVDGTEPITADPDDDKFVRCAQQVGATVVSGDRHLLDVDGWNGVRVMPPARLANSLAQDDDGAT